MTCIKMPAVVCLGHTVAVLVGRCLRSPSLPNTAVTAVVPLWQGKFWKCLSILLWHEPPDSVDAVGWCWSRGALESIAAHSSGCFLDAWADVILVYYLW